MTIQKFEEMIFKIAFKDEIYRNDYLSYGGFELKLEDGQKIIFDFEDEEWDIDPENKKEMTVHLWNLDTKSFPESSYLNNNTLFTDNIEFTDFYIDLEDSKHYQVPFFVEWIEFKHKTYDKNGNFKQSDVIFASDKTLYSANKFIWDHMFLNDSEYSKYISKVFISQAMNGISEEEVMKSREHAAYDIMNKLQQPFYILDNYHREYAPKDAGRLWYLGESIKQMDQADYIYFTDEGRAKGCIVERLITALYNVKEIR